MVVQSFIRRLRRAMLLLVASRLSVSVGDSPGISLITLSPPGGNERSSAEGVGTQVTGPGTNRGFKALSRLMPCFHLVRAPLAAL